jgi:shikimate dehydrogenase
MSRRPPLTTQTKIYGHFSNATEFRPLGGVVEYINRLLDECQADCLYIPLQVSPENLETAIKGLVSLRYFSGFTVTMPHKEKVASLCNSLMPNALGCSSVNAVKIEANGSLTGESFDGVGISKAIQTRRALNTNTNILVYGAGGVGQAISVALTVLNVGRVHIANRTLEKGIYAANQAKNVAKNTEITCGLDFNVKDFDIIIQATSVGSGSDTSMIPIDLEKVNKSSLIVEAVRTPEMTNFLIKAKDLGLEYVKGNEMLTPQIQSIMSFLGMS